MPIPHCPCTASARLRRGPGISQSNLPFRLAQAIGREWAGSRTTQEDAA
jgi:hypothetical protein